MLAALGTDFTFGLSTVPFDKLSQSLKADWAKGERVGNLPARQFTGLDETITLPGVMAPQFTGGEIHIERLKEMLRAGRPYMFTTGNGQVWGLWVIEGLDITHERLLADGTPQKIEFTLKLAKYGDGDEASL